MTASNAYKLLKYGLEYALKLNTTKNFSNFYTDWGHQYEEVARNEYERQFETEVLHNIFVTNAKYPLAGCSPDGVDLKDTTLLEIKCFQLEKHNSIQTEEDLLKYPEIMAQIQFELLLLELDKAKLLLYHPDEGLRVIKINRNEQIINNLIERLK